RMVLLAGDATTTNLPRAVCSRLPRRAIEECPMTEAVSRGGWNPNQYDRFKAEREQPFFDLAALVQREPGMRVADLGCGDGRLTAWLHGELGASETLGIDSSAEMLAKSEAHRTEGVRFERL